MVESKFRAGRPLWRQGMLVRPQHMQQQDLYHEQNLDARLRAVQPNTWGVIQVAFDQTALRASNNISVTQFQGVFPDGTVVDFAWSSPPSARPVGEVPLGERGVGVFLSTPLIQHGVENISYEGVTRRYTLRERSVFDLVDIKTQDAQVEDFCVGEPTVVLTVGEPRENHSWIQIGLLVRGEDGDVTLDDNYVPPLLALGGSQWLCEQLDKVLSHAITRRRSEDGRLRTEAVTLRALRLTDLRRMLFCTALDRMIPVLRSLAKDRRSPPYDIYNAVAQLCGELSVPCGGDSTVLPLYSHQSLHETFGGIFPRLHMQLDVEFGQHYTTIPLIDKGNYWAAQSPHLATSKRMFLVLNGGAQMQRKELKRVFRAKAKVASAQRLRELVQKAATGLPITLLDRGPDDVPSRRGDVFFGLDMSHRLWEEVSRDEQIGLFISAKEFGPKHVEARLIALLDEGAHD